MYSSWLKGKTTLSSKRKPNVHGGIPGIPPGSTFASRRECSDAGVHAPLQAGIHGDSTYGAYSVVLSYGYEDDQDAGETFIYSGQGGRDTLGDKMDQLQGKRKREGPQATDQEWVRGNKALKISCTTKRPVRVIRGANRKGSNSKYAPSEGYRYDGLYVVVRAWRAVGVTGFKVCMFQFQRLPHQPPLPGDPPKPAPTVSITGPAKLPPARAPTLAPPLQPSRPIAGPSNIRLPHITRPQFPINAAVRNAQPSYRPRETPRNMAVAPLRMVRVEPLSKTLQDVVRVTKRPRDENEEEEGSYTAQWSEASKSGVEQERWATVTGKKAYEGLKFSKK